MSRATPEINTQLRVLLVDDNPADVLLLRESLQPLLSQEVASASSLGSAMDLAQQQDFDALLLDLSLPDSQGLCSVSRAVAKLPTTAIVVLTGLHDEHLAVEAMRLGAQDYLVKGQITAPLILRALRYAIQRKQAQMALQQAHDQLEHKVQERTADLRSALEALQDEVQQRLAAEEERRTAEMEVLRAAENEQRRIGRDLHDTIQGNLAGMGFLLTGLVRKLRSAGVAEELVAQAEELKTIAHDTLQQTRDLSRGLCPVDLSSPQGLPKALTHLSKTISSMFRLQCEFTCSNDAPPLDEAVATNLYYIANEAINNAIKHSGSRRIQVQLLPRESQLSLRVEDDGVGVPDGSSATQGLGVRTMNYRARLIGGELTITRGPKCGTIVSCIVPSK